MESAQQYAFERSQLIRIELADSRSQAKLPMNLAGLLHLFNVNCEWTRHFDQIDHTGPLFSPDSTYQQIPQ